MTVVRLYIWEFKAVSRSSSLTPSFQILVFTQMESLFGSLPEMLEFQKVFLETLEDGISASSDFNILETPSQFRVSIVDVGLKQIEVGTVQSSPLEEKAVSLDC